MTSPAWRSRSRGGSISITALPSPPESATSARWIGPNERTWRTAPSSEPVPAGPICMSWRRTNSFEAPEAAPSAAMLSGWAPRRTGGRAIGGNFERRPAEPHGASGYLHRQHDGFADEAMDEGGGGIVIDIAGR